MLPTDTLMHQRHRMSSGGTRSVRRPRVRSPVPEISMEGHLGVVGWPRGKEGSKEEGRVRGRGSLLYVASKGLGSRLQLPCAQGEPDFICQGNSS